ncbi:MAG TPA: PEP-CTERM sorting domain-containing protein [Stellaceae bacterium]
MATSGTRTRHELSFSARRLDADAAPGARAGRACRTVNGAGLRQPDRACGAGQIGGHRRDAYVPPGYGSDIPGLHTYGFSEPVSQFGGYVFTDGALYVDQQDFMGFHEAGTPANAYFEHTQFVAANSLANLSVPPGSSIHVYLGQIVADAMLPVGSYTTDIGIYQQCGSGLCMVLSDMPPSFVDAGPLTIEVAVPEPAAALLLASGLAGFGFATRGNRKR